MRKTYRKTGSLVIMACLSLLAAGFISNGNVMASQVSRPHHHKMHRMHKPHVTLQVIPNTTRYFNHQYVARAVIYGVGFDNCGNCGPDQGTDNPCDSGCGNPPPPPTPSDTTPPCDPGCGNPPPPPPCDTGCGNPPPPPPTTPSDTPSPCEAGCTTSHQEVTDKVTTTDVQTTITTTTTTNVSHHSTGCKADCTPAVPPNTVPCNACSSSNSVPSDNSRNNYNNSRNNYNNSRNNYNNSRNSYNNSRNSYNDTTPNATCPSYNSCGTGPDTNTGPNTGPGDTSGCDCNTANLQGNVPFSSPGINLSRIPVNTFGEFRVGVNIRMSPRQARTRPSFWATNTYGQRSDSAPVPCCSSSFCCS